jgi:hypothetical protein
MTVRQFALRVRKGARDVLGPLPRATDGDGDYTLSAVVPGNYVVQFDPSCYGTATLTISLLGGKKTRYHVELS